MAEEARRDMRMVGETASAGGEYRNVKLVGEGVFSGNVDCVKLSQVGELEIRGNLRVKEIKVTGECEVQGRLDAITASGRGELTIRSDLRGEKIRFTGNIETGGDCEAGVFEVGGAFQVSGLLSADKLDVKMYGPCKAREIGGSTLRVRRSRATKLLDLIKAREPFVLTADQIEGDIVELEHTVAEVVRGNRVAIGPGCRIGRVEYQQSLKTHKSASVGHSVRR